MMSLKTLLALNQKPVLGVDVFNQIGAAGYAMFSLHYPDNSPIFYADGKMVPGSDNPKYKDSLTWVGQNGIARRVQSASGIYHAAYVWHYFDLQGNALGMKSGQKGSKILEHDFPMPNGAWEMVMGDVTGIQDVFDIERHADEFSGNVYAQGAASTQCATWIFHGKNWFCQLPRTAELMQKRAQELKKLLAQSGNSDAVVSYLAGYMGLMQSIQSIFMPGQSNQRRQKQGKLCAQMVQADCKVY